MYLLSNNCVPKLYKVNVDKISLDGRQLFVIVSIVYKNIYIISMLLY